MLKLEKLRDVESEKKLQIQNALKLNSGNLLDMISL